MNQPDGNKLSPTSRALEALSTLGTIVLIYMVLFMHTQADWWMWAVEVGMFILPAAGIVFVEHNAR